MPIEQEVSENDITVLGNKIKIADNLTVCAGEAVRASRKEAK